MGVPLSALDEWDARDIDLALAELAIEADTGRYGESLSEAMSPGADPTNYESGWGYRVVGPFTNFAERLVGEAQDQFRKALPEGAHMPAGLSWRVERYEYTPVAEGEYVEVQLERDAYGVAEA